LLVYVGFLFALNADSDPVAGSIAQLARTSVPLETRTTMPVVQSVTLKDVLQADPGLASAMADGLIQIQEQDSSSLVRMWGLFPSGQGAVAPESEPLVAAVGQGLAQFEGRVRVVGHTDDQPIGSLRFPNNWILSETRADSVREVLARSVDPGRLTTEGLADSEPLVENDSAVNRALNRRVEITLYYSRGEL
jgi:type VI secretion system protein ImpK